MPVNEPYSRRTSHGLILAEGGEKMSKSKGNVVNPDSIVESFGADTLRLYEMFMGPFEQAIEWNESSLAGPRRFLERIWRLQTKVDRDLKDSSSTLMHKTIKKVSQDIESMGFNTAVSTLMIFANDLDKREKISSNEYEILLKLLAPFAPHLSEELWHTLGHIDSVHIQNWPQYDPNQLKESEIVIAVQVNGKMRGKFQAASDISESDVTNLAKNLPEIQKWIGDKAVRKQVYVPGKVLNLIV